MFRTVVALAGVFGFSLITIVVVHAQETFDVQWQAEPIDRISRTTGSSVDVKFKSGATMTVKRTPPEAVAVQLNQCVFTLEVFFASFPKSGKEEAGLVLSTQEGPAFGCQIVMVIQLIAGDCCRAEVTAEQIFTEYLIKLIHDRSENLKDLCFRPNPNPPGNPPLPRYDRFTQVPSTSFRKVTPTTWVFADTPRFPAQAVPEKGIPIGLPDGFPVERRSLHRGDKLQIIRKWITFFFGTCEAPTTTSISEVSISPTMAAVLLFYVRWSCAHEMTAAADPGDWTGRRIAGKPVHPGKFPTIPEPIHGDANRDYQDATSQRSQAQQSQPETGAVDSFRPFECPD